MITGVNFFCGTSLTIVVPVPIKLMITSTHLKKNTPQTSERNMGMLCGGERALLELHVELLIQKHEHCIISVSLCFQSSPVVFSV